MTKVDLVTLDHEERTRNALADNQQGRAVLYFLPVFVLIVVLGFAFWDTGETKLFKRIIPVAMWLLGPLLVAGATASLRSRQLRARNAHLVLRDDQRPPVLYLRSFQDDGVGRKLVKTRSRVYFSSTEEENLTSELKSLGPVVAIGRPGDDIPELGASRLYVGDDQWQQQVASLLDSSCLIVLRIGQTAGIQWELQRVAKQSPAEKVVLWTKKQALGQDVLETLPPAARSAPWKSEFIYFTSDWQPFGAESMLRVLKAKGLWRIDRTQRILDCAVWLAIIGGIVLILSMFLSVFF